MRAPTFDETYIAIVLTRVYDVLGLVHSPPEEQLDRFTWLVSKFFEVPVALVSFVQEELDRQYFKSEIGLGGHWKELRQTPLAHSFRQIVKRENRPMVVGNAPRDARVCDNRAVPELGVRAYLGAPVHGPDRQPLGALCAIDSHYRNWSQGQIDAMVDLAACVTDQISLRGLRQGLNLC